MIIEQLRNLFIFAVIFLVGFAVVKFFPFYRRPVCPDEYDNREEYVEAVGKWAADYYKKNPKATIDEAVSARRSYLLENECRDFSEPQTSYPVTFL